MPRNGNDAPLNYLLSTALKGKYELRLSTKQNTSARNIQKLQKDIHELCARGSNYMYRNPSKYTYWKPKDRNYLLYELDDPQRLVGFLSMRPFEIKNEFDPQVGEFKFNHRELDRLKLEEIVELSLICSHRDLRMGRLLMTVAKALARAKNYKALFIELSQVGEADLERFYRKHGAVGIKPTQELISVDGMESYDYPYQPRLEYWYDDKFPSLPAQIPNPRNRRRMGQEMKPFLKGNRSRFMAILKPSRKELVTLKDARAVAALPPIPQGIYCGARKLPAGKRYGTVVECRRQTRRFGLSQLSTVQKRKIRL